MKINAVIVDDVKNSREVLAQLLAKFCPEVEMMGEAADVNEGYSLIKSKKPDLVFLDVQMPPESGFDLLKKFDSIPFSVIFITSYDQYAITAIKFSAIDYLLKPVDVSELKSALSKVITKKEDAERQIINLLENISDETPDKKIGVHVNGKVRFIKSSSVTYIESVGAFVEIHNAEGEKFASFKTLNDFEEFLAPNLAFIRINRSILLNVEYIKEYSKGDHFIITLNSGKVLESSRRRKPDVLERLKGFS